jgi:lipoprotein NlpD
MLNLVMININKIRFTGIIAAISVLAGCNSMRAPAPVLDRAPAPKSVEVKSRPLPADKQRGFYTVKKGDTLYRIALEFGQNYRDIVIWNNLASPDDIKIDQVLRVLPPEGGVAKDSAQTGSIASGSGVEVRPLGTQPAGGGHASNKTAPRGDKRPFSENALADMQKGEGSASQASAPEQGKAASSDQEGKASDSQSGGSDDGGVDWMWPAEGKLIAAFDAGKKGIDIAGKMGQPVVAAGAGKVLYAGRMRGYGNLVIVKHTNSLLSAYAHGKTILVKEGQTVSKGQKIAEMGNSDADTVKLHFEIRQQGKPVDPSKYLPSR